MRVGGRPVGCETPGYSGFKRRHQKSCQHLEQVPVPGSWQEMVAGGGRGKHAVRARSLLLQNSTCDGQQASAQALGHFCSFLGWQRGLSGSAVATIPSFPSTSAHPVSRCDALNFHMFQCTGLETNSTQTSLDTGTFLSSFICQIAVSNYQQICVSSLLPFPKQEKEQRTAKKSKYFGSTFL